MTSMKQIASTVVSPAEMSTSAPPSHSARTTLTIASRLAAKARDAVEADVMPEHMTAKAIRNVTKWMPNALCA